MSSLILCACLTMIVPIKLTWLLQDYVNWPEGSSWSNSGRIPWVRRAPDLQYYNKNFTAVKAKISALKILIKTVLWKSQIGKVGLWAYILHKYCTWCHNVHPSVECYNLFYISWIKQETKNDVITVHILYNNHIQMTLHYSPIYVSQKQRALTVVYMSKLND
jgi:hypothetical protein